MIRKLLFTILMTILIGLNVSSSSAQISIEISSFTTSFRNIGWDALNNRSARIPVSWTTQNRLVISNLIFEQIFPDGSRINVELPRLINYVASNGDGIVAPILPDDSGSPVIIRVSLINLLTGSVYDMKELYFPIISGDTGGDDVGYAPAITLFDATYSAPINPTELINGTVLIPVSWTAINRPIASNLVFEQVMPDGTLLNVELPRDNPWVNSSGNGVVAPIYPPDDADHISLRLSLLSFGQRNLIDRRTITIPIQTEITTIPPTITVFTSNTRQILDEAVNDSLIDVSWAVTNRPPNTNLVFEQVMPDGTVRNAELPRSVLIVPSEGVGIVDPILPNTLTNSLQFRMSLLDLTTNLTLISSEFTIDLVTHELDDVVVVTGDACYTGSFAPSQNLIIGSEGRVQSRNNNFDTAVYSDFNNDDIIGYLSAGDSLTIQADPYCTYSLANGNHTSRRWRILLNGQVGWVEEYTTGDGGFVFNFVRADLDDLAQATINSFTVSPTSVEAGELANTTFTLTWDTSHAIQMNINQVGDITTDIDSGSTTVNGANVILSNDSINFYITVQDSQNNRQNLEVIVPIATDVSITEFTVSPDAVAGNEDATFTWAIAGEFASATIWTSAPYNFQLAVIHQITENTGTFTYTLPDNYDAGNLTFTLDISNNEGVRSTQETILSYTCAYQWGLNITNTQCPSTGVLSNAGAYQTFQNGFMLWIPEHPDSLWVFYNDGRVESYLDGWDGNAYTIEAIPPEGTFAPERGFGYLWQATASVREGLGWATSNEQSYTLSYQSALVAARYSRANHYFQLPDGRVIRAGVDTFGLPMMWSLNS